jgi:L-rhamnonate dehydratase
LENPRLVRIEWGLLEGERPRHAGSNARIGNHGLTVRVPVARVTTEDSATGWGRCNADREALAALLGRPLDELFDPNRGATDMGLPCEYPLWDLLGKRAGKPVFALAAAITGMAPPALYRVPCYDTSLYFDDLHLTSDDEAATLIAAEAREGDARGHRAFKSKVGRGGRWLPLEAGTRRDIAIVRAVRAAVGPEPPLMLDANNGWNLNLTKHVLAETADCGIFWMEEPFHEDPRLYEDLHGWLEREGLPTLIADGEGEASPSLLAWARDGLIDVVQYDIFAYGFTRWLATGAKLDAWGKRSAPHHYGAHLGNYYAPHLMGALRGFTFAEWDEATTPGITPAGYVVADGSVSVPDAPGFGLELDDTVFRSCVDATGFRLAQ